MRFFIWLGLVIAVITVLAIGLLPPLLDRGKLDTEALNAARAASAVVQSGNRAAATAAAEASIAKDPGVELVSVTFRNASLGPFVQVKVREKVRTFMDGLPGLEGWFNLTSTQESQLGQ